jgi:hypothetical protein
MIELQCKIILVQYFLLNIIKIHLNEVSYICLNKYQIQGILRSNHDRYIMKKIKFIFVYISLSNKI